MHNVAALEPFVDHPLFDIQQHTYSHTLLKDDHWKGGTFLASPPVAIEQEVRQTSEALRRLLGVECIGLRTPHGYHLGLTDRPEMLAVLQPLRHPLRVVVGAQRRGDQPDTAVGAAVLVPRAGLPRPARDPVPALARRHLVRGVRHRSRRGVRRTCCEAAIDEIVADDLVYGACFHDWAQLRYRETETGWVRALMRHAQASGVATLSYRDFYVRESEARVPA